MDETTLTKITAFLARYQTLVLATEDEGQPYATRIFFVEEPATATACRLYGTLITTSRKLANLRRNPRAGLFVGPDQPSVWMEATAYARVLDDEASAAEVRASLARKSPTAAAFISRVPTAAVELDINWLRITDLTGGAPYTEATFGGETEPAEQRV
jgi:nitroimidazol reductase NimA-like FMN-containing flavoprotein (pyridoxamine 5'-phosphate oxidase superfamily)